VDRTGLYEEDVHHDLTYVLAIAAGFESLSAANIARANNDVDLKLSTTPYVNPLSRKKFHFSSAKGRQEMFAAATRERSEELLGNFLHAQQDSYSHRGYGYLAGHALAGGAPDETYRDPGMAVAAARSSFNSLVQYRTATGQGSFLVPFSEIEPLVLEFAKASTKSRKDFLLGKLLKKLETVKTEQSQ
jgi:hypothetical protein